MILEGLHGEYNPFVMQMYGCATHPTLCDVKTLLYMQEAQLDEFHKKLATSNVVANVSHTSQEDNNSRGAHSFHRGRGRLNRGRGRNTIVNRPTCQLCGKYSTFSHHVLVSV